MAALARQDARKVTKAAARDAVCRSRRKRSLRRTRAGRDRQAAVHSDAAAESPDIAIAR